MSMEPRTSMLPLPNEQRHIEELLLKLAKISPFKEPSIAKCPCTAKKRKTGTDLQSTSRDEL
jgi:hypothetical protein